MSKSRRLVKSTSRPQKRPRSPRRRSGAERASGGGAPRAKKEKTARGERAKRAPQRGASGGGAPRAKKEKTARGERAKRAPQRGASGGGAPRAGKRRWL